MAVEMKRLKVTCVARNAPKANFLTCVTGGVTVKQARGEIQKIFEKVQSSQVTLTSLWSHDGYRLFDKADILPLVDQDSHIIACDKETFPSDAMSRKRSAADAEDDAGSDSELVAPTVVPTKGDATAKKKQKPSAYNQFMSKQLPLYKAAHPLSTSKENFMAVAAQWKTDPANPKNAGKAPAEEELPPLTGNAESLTDGAESLVDPAEKKKKKKKKKKKEKQ